MNLFRYVITFAPGTPQESEAEGFMEASWIGDASLRVTKRLRLVIGARLKSIEAVGQPSAGTAMAFARVRS